MPTSVQVKIDDKEIDEVLRSVGNKDVLAVTSVTNVTNTATTPDPTVTNVTLQDTIQATKMKHHHSLLPFF